MAGATDGAPAHSHGHYEETIYGIDGVLTWTVDGKPIDVCPEQASCIPRGVVQRFDNVGDQDAKVICVITPAANQENPADDFAKFDEVLRKMPSLK